MKEALRIIYVIILAMFIALLLVFSNDLHTIHKLTNGYTVVKMQQLKAKCEETLTRQQQCAIVVSAVPISKEK